ncbi:hypothetical protein H0V99_03180 [Candidatus Saccharibacteria bacterium]|nr:hypothetical protein [Candidatus Saccharibacteria bacterium]
MSEIPFNNIGEPSEELKQQFQLLILDNVPAGPEKVAEFIHPDGREFGLMRPFITADDPDYESKDLATIEARLYYIFIEEPVVRDSVVIANISTGYYYDPVKRIIEKIDISLKSLDDMILGFILEAELEDIGLKDAVSGTELDNLLVDIQIAIDNSGQNTRFK